MDFAGYLHNMYGYEYLSEERKKDIDKLKEMENSDSNYNINDEIDKIILAEFKSLDELHKSGLKIHFNKLKTKVFENKYMPLILYGANKTNKTRDYYIYTTVNKKKLFYLDRVFVIFY